MRLVSLAQKVAFRRAARLLGEKDVGEKNVGEKGVGKRAF